MAARARKADELEPIDQPEPEAADEPEPEAQSATGTTRMQSPDGDEFDIVPAGVRALLELGWKAI